MSDSLATIAELERLYAAAPARARNKVDVILSSAVDQLREELATLHVRERLALIPPFADRTDRSERAIAYFHRHYQSVLDAGDFYADDLKQHDERLYGALSAYLGLRGKSLATILPIRTSYRPGRRRRGEKR